MRVCVRLASATQLIKRFADRALRHARLGGHLGLVSCLIALAAGCGGKTPPPIVTVEGVIQLENKPLNKVEVRFIPVDDFGPEYMAKGVTDERGRYKVTCKAGPGACLGESYVVIVEPEIPANLRSENAQAELDRYLKSLGNRPLPKRYSNLADTPLRVNVVTERKDYDFQLKRD
jgi:hypothetical protein